MFVAIISIVCTCIGIIMIISAIRDIEKEHQLVCHLLQTTMDRVTKLENKDN